MGSSLPLVESDSPKDAAGISLGGNLGCSSISLPLDSTLHPLLSWSSSHSWRQRSTVCSPSPSLLLHTWAPLHLCRSHCWPSSQREINSSDPYHVFKAVFLHRCMVPYVLC